jgi:hypothetical protein
MMRVNALGEMITGRSEMAVSPWLEYSIKTRLTLGD